MNKFEFEQKSLMLKAFSERVFSLGNDPLIQKSVEDLKHLLVEKEQENTLRIAVCGQYSAGKSSLIQALTQNSEIRIGQDVTTDSIQFYHWNGIEIADTPGIYAGRLEHDALSLDFIRKADLLIYMITIQGFTREIGMNFKKLIQEKYIDKTMLLMNKRNQEPAENEQNWRRDTSDFVGDQVLSKLYFSIIDVEDYINGVRENIPELVTESHFDEFVQNLNLFIKEKGLIGKIIARINIIDNFLSDSETAFSNTPTVEAFCETKLQAVSAAISKCERAVTTARTRIIQKIQDLKYHLINLVTNETLEEFRQEIDGIEIKMEELLDDKQLPEDIQMILTDTKDVLEAVDQDINLYENQMQKKSSQIREIAVDNPVDLSAFRSGAQELSHLLGGVTKEGVVQVAHWLGHSFKPWGATKLTNFIKGLGPWLAGVEVAIDVISWAADKKHQAEMENVRIELRDTFTQIEQDVQEQFESMKMSENSVLGQLRHIQKNLQEQKKKYEDENMRKKELVSHLHELQKELASLKLTLCS